MTELFHHTFDILSDVPGLVHGVFTRNGGVSRPPYDSLNVASNNGDSPEAVFENLRRIREALGIDRLISARQVHGDAIHLIDKETMTGMDDRSPVHVLPPADGLATRFLNAGLLIKVADCQPVFLVDPVQKVIANVHSGWRGSVQGIVPKTVRTLSRRFGTRPRDLLAGVGPSLGPCCAQFIHYRGELPEAFWRFQPRPYYFDFWAITRRQLMDVGVPPQGIEISGRCTACGPEEFFSHRGEGSPGRMAAVLAWKSPG